MNREQPQLRLHSEEFVDEFISEDDLTTFGGWSRYQTIDPSTLTEEQLTNWRGIFDEAMQRIAANSKVGLMKLPPVPGEFKYAIVVKEGADLWLVLWVRRSPKGESFVIKPIGDRDWNPHTSYHLDGTLHMKSHGHKVLPPKKCQPPTNMFRGCQPLMQYAGYAPKGIGAVCDPTAFTGVVEVAPGILGPRHGQVAVDLVEPGHLPTNYTQCGEIVRQKVFREVTPNVVITVYVNNVSARGGPMIGPIYCCTPTEQTGVSDALAQTAAVLLLK